MPIYSILTVVVKPSGKVFSNSTLDGYLIKSGVTFVRSSPEPLFLNNLSYHKGIKGLPIIASPLKERIFGSELASLKTT